MLRSFRIASIVAVGAMFASDSFAEQPPATHKALVELRWVETTYVEGLTEIDGVQSSCDPNDVVYPHKEPALTLGTANVKEARIVKHEFSNNSLGTKYMVNIELTEEAREALAATCEGNGVQLLTVAIDGKYSGVRRYEKENDKKGAPEHSKARAFAPSVGFFSSRAEAEVLVNAFK